VRPAAQGRAAAGRVAFLAVLLPVCCRAAPERIRYAIPEELGRGSLVGPLARDLGLSPADLPARKLRIVSGDEKQYFTLGEDNANLRVNERIDREGICGAVSPCVLSLEAVVEKPFNIFHVSVTIQDINDNPPQFDREFVAIEMIESTPPGARIPLSSGKDPDIGANSLQNYQLTPNPLFSLVVRESLDGTKHVELVLEKSLDREKQRNHHLILTAVDGGDPVRSGTAQIKINVTDANDNPPVFTKEIYKVRLLENLPEGSLAFQVKATDGDEGTNAEITYSFSDIANSARQLFALDSRTGDVKITGPLDYEEGKCYEASVEGKDGGGLSAHAKVHIDILDVNDNAPTLSLLPILNPIPEDAVPSTVVALINVRDRDSGDNGEVSCNIGGDFPFRLEPSSANAYKLVIASAIDREKVSAYNVTITARDRGIPALSSRAALVLEVSDVNDNAPVFEEAAYSAYVAENNAAGAAVVRVRARDADAGANGRVSYWLAGGSAGAAGAAAYVSVEARSGAVYAQRSFDYEQCREFAVAVRAQDGGAPARSSTATVRVFALGPAGASPAVVRPGGGVGGGVGAAALRGSRGDAEGLSVAELLSELGSAAAAPGEAAGSLTRWLVVAVAAVSCLFLAFLLLLLALRLRRWRRSPLLAAGSGALRGVPASHFVGIDGVRAFLHSYSHEVSLTADSRKSQLRLSAGSCCDTLPARPPAEASGELVATGDHVAE
ncbi:Protocadherin gamma-B3, partial [Spheniscus humboldti]